MASLELRDMLNVNRFPTGWKLFFLMLYFPLGVLIALVRILLAVILILAATIIPQASFVKSFIVHATCFLLGIFVKQEGTVKRDVTVQVFVSNHVSLLDHMALHLVSGCITVSILELPATVSRALGVRDVEPQQGEAALENEARKHIGKSDKPLLLFPERETTSGQLALLKFSPWPFRVTNKVQPVAFEVWRPPIADVAVTVLGAQSISDLLWFMFVPFTLFKIRFLPIVGLQENEEPDVAIQRVESSIASSLRIKTTSYTAADKAEYEKRYLAELYQPVMVNPSSESIARNSDLQRMCLQVKSVFPHVPASAIFNDLLKTRDVDVTVTNILDGNVQYTPEPDPPATTSTAGQSSKVPQASSGTLNFFSQTSPQKRAMTFQEKKALMIETARQKYIEKHGLQTSTS